MRKALENGVALLVVGAVVLSMTVVALGDERSERLDREATSIYQQVFSPFCPGRSLNDCPSSKAAELKDELRAKLEAGAPSEEVLREVFQRYGDQYRAVPLFAGVGVLVWIAPIIFIVLGLLIVFTFSRGTKSRSASGVPIEASGISPEARQRIDEELSRLE